MKGDILRGHLDVLLLATVRSLPSHGYAIIEELRRKSTGAFDLAEGTVYPALHRLEAEGYLSSRWARKEGRRRRVYELTKDGHRVLGERTDDWKKFSVAMQVVLEVR